jgi:ribosomal protein L29
MKTNDKKELKAKTESELTKMLKDFKEQLMKLKLEKAQKRLGNTSELTNIRKKIAVILTIQNEKELIKNG